MGGGEDPWSCRNPDNLEKMVPLVPRPRLLADGRSSAQELTDLLQMSFVSPGSLR